LLADAIQRAWRKFIAGLSWYRDSTRFRRVLELAVAATGYDQVPTIFIKLTKNLADFHSTIMRRSVYRSKSAA